MNISDLRLYHPEIIDIETEHRKHAREWSNPVMGEAQQWSVYLHGLAFAGLIQWLEQQGEYVVDLTHCSLLNPIYANVMDAVCNVEINDFKVCLIATEHIIDETVTIPCAAIDLPSFSAHLYVLLEVWEEQNQIIFRGIVRRDQVEQYRTTLQLQPSEDWTYAFPLSMVDWEPNYLLHYLQHLTPEAIPLPKAAVDNTVLNLVDLEALITELDTSDNPLWQRVNWEQGRVIFESPEFLALLHQKQMQSEQNLRLDIRLREVAMLLTQTAVDTTVWLQNQLDEVAQRLEIWTPSRQTPAMGMRRTGTFESAIALLENSGLRIPENSLPMYQDIELNGIPLRLCSVVIPPGEHGYEEREPSQWSLLTILGSQAGRSLPAGTQLQVSKLSSVLEAPVLEFDEPFLYAVADAAWGEMLVITIVMDGVFQTLTPYWFGHHKDK